MAPHSLLLGVFTMWPRHGLSQMVQAVLGRRKWLPSSSVTTAASASEWLASHSMSSARYFRSALYRIDKRSRRSRCPVYIGRDDGGMASKWKTRYVYVLLLPLSLHCLGTLSLTGVVRPTASWLRCLSPTMLSSLLRVPLP
ncbi:hypothetical protein C8Q74DRAFT_257750 [Fomes fomentarius]|nr:hypothetical protein C8Q74DRAFT_257750 [Fomes fomentarius]